MKGIKNFFLTSISIFFPQFIWAQYIQVSDQATAQDLIQNTLLNNSPCASASNFLVSGGNFGTGQQSYGFFTNGGSSFPFTNGIVLSTGKAVSAEGPNATLLSESAPGWIGDSDLEQALNISNTSNATVLEFDFIPRTSKISFDYIFASEEYHDNAPCRYSDGFAFLLKLAGTTDNYENLALIPNTSIPVKVTTVHPDIPGACAAQNSNYFGSYNNSNAPINFNGQTVVMTAKASVIPNQTYHIKLVIADETNPEYDSAIFLDGGSFNVGTDLGKDRLIATNNPLCFGETLILDATEVGTNNYQWFKNGTAISGATNPNYNVREAGVYEVSISINGSACIATGKITIEYSNPPILNDQVLVQCDDNNDGITTYNLTQLDALISGGQTQLSPVLYFESLQNAQNGNNAIPNPTSYQNNTTNHLYAKVSNAFGCVSYANVILKIANNNIPNQSPILICDTDGNDDGLTTIDFNTMVSPQLLAGLPSGLTVAYYANPNDALLQVHSLPNSFTNSIPNQQLIYARIVNGSNCYGIIPITLSIIIFSPPHFQEETLYLCAGSSLNLSVDNGFSSYLWSNGNSTHQINITNSGNYSVVVTNSVGCSKTKNFLILDSEIASIDFIEINDFLEDQNSVVVHFTGISNYEFSIDGIHFQESPIFYNVPIGSYQVTVKDKHYCGETKSSVFYVLDYPKFFTPNGDGYNDYWRIKNLESQSDAKIYIFDRYGKLIRQLTPFDNGWDGTLNGNLLQSDDYWFSLFLNNHRMVKGHFALKR